MADVHPLQAIRFRVSRSVTGRPTYLRTGGALFRSSPQRLFTFTEHTTIRPQQVRSEFVALLEQLQRREPNATLEIGTWRGGTLFMMCQMSAPDARLATIDLELRDADLYARFARRTQEVVPIEGSSRDPDVRARVAALFPDGLDVLFIDGDHSYEGVASDFDAYEPLLRPGGLLVFHDIVPDTFEKTGVADGGSSGDVPRFWREFKARSAATWQVQELVDSWEQGGAGIGVGTKPSARRPR